MIRPTEGHCRKMSEGLLTCIQPPPLHNENLAPPPMPYFRYYSRDKVNLL